MSVALLAPLLAAEEERTHAAGDWGGARTRLEQLGIAIEGYLVSDASNAFAGGLRTSRGVLRALLGLNLTIGTERLLDWKGGTLFVDFFSFLGEDATATAVGDFQVLSNLDIDERTQVAELWFEQRLGRFRIRVGKVDANADFAFVEHGLGFLHSSPGFSPTIFVFPSYPESATAVVGFFEGAHAYAGVGLFDGAPNTGRRGPGTFFGAPSDLFWIGEAGLVDEKGRIGFGVWHHTGTFDRFDGGTDDATTGLYLVLDWSVREGLGAFLQLGTADGSVSEVDLHVGTGVARTGPFEGRPSDTVGIMASYVRFSDEAGAGFTEDFELAVEVFYEVELRPWLVVKPDLQFIVNPGGDAALDDALVGTLRIEITF